MEPRCGQIPPPRSITWVGHATLLVQVDGLSILTDPSWSERAGPTSFIGARRLSAPGLAFEALPRIDVVTISHDHYDHLDLPTVKRLAATHDPLFVVPLGLKAWFEDNGMPRVVELDWWQEYEHRGVRFVCTPAQHFSQRSLWDGNRRLWASWAVLGRERRFYHSGRHRLLRRLQGDRAAARPLRRGRAGDRRLPAARDHEVGAPHARAGGAGLRGSRRAHDARHALGHVRPGRRAARRAARAHARRRPPARDRPGSRLGPRRSGRRRGW